MKEAGACPECSFVMGATSIGLDSLINHCPRCLKRTAMWERLLTAAELQKSIELFQDEADRYQTLIDKRSKILKALQDHKRR